MSFLKKTINQNNKIELYKFVGENFVNLSKEYQNESALKVCFLDLETTGSNKETSKIIEFAGKLTAIDKNNGELIGIIDSYQSFNDPEEPISQEITRITGITDEDVEGHSLNWGIISQIMHDADIIVAHNASFDRAFMDRYLPLSKDKVWVCSVNDINWAERGFNARGQEILCIWHGFYYESHRAMYDVDALIHLVTYDVKEQNKASLELIENSTKSSYQIAAINSAYETKDLLKSRKYRWNPTRKYWWKNIFLEDLESEKEWMADNIYNGHFQGQVVEISLTDKYKS
jgi:DNA polymerase-3 subunit epsilon